MNIRHVTHLNTANFKCCDQIIVINPSSFK